MGTAGNMVGQAGNLVGQAGAMVGQSAGIRGQAANIGMQGAQGYVAIDPYQRALGSNLPTAVGQMSTTMGGMVGNAYGQSLGQTLGYVSDLNNTNFNAEWSDYLNVKNERQAERMGQMQAGAAKGAGDSAMMSGGIAAGGAVLGVAIAI